MDRLPATEHFYSTTNREIPDIANGLFIQYINKLEIVLIFLLLFLAYTLLARSHIGDYKIIGVFCW